MIRSVISLLLIVQFSTALVQQIRTLSRDSHLQAASSIGDDTILDIIAGNLANCLILSDVKRMTGNDGASTGWTSWVDEKSCFRLQKCIDKLVLVNPVGPTDPARIDLLEQRDEAQRWIRWMKNSPAPMIIEVSDEFRRLVDVNLDDTSLEVRFCLQCFDARQIVIHLLFLPCLHSSVIREFNPRDRRCWTELVSELL